jgi:predicted ATP-grasp superfamily ATP-dependent carboligase
VGARDGSVLIVGVSTRALAESASRAGYSCSTVDAFGDLDQKSLVPNIGLWRDRRRRYSAAAAVALGRSAGDFAAYVGNLENHPAAVRRLARGRQLWGNTPATLLRARDPVAVGEVVRRAGGRVPLTLRPDQAPHAPAGVRWLRKPRHGGGGSGVREWSGGPPPAPHELVQERIEGVLASASFVADGQRAVVLGIARGLAGDPAFGARGHRYCGSVYPFSADQALLDRMSAIAEVATAAFGLVGLNGIDFVLREGEPYVLEINPRYCASMELIERGRGISMFEAHVAGCGHALPAPARVVPRDVLGKAVVYARRDVVVGDSRPWLQRDDVRDVPFPGDHIRRGQPVCTVFARGADSVTCYARLVAAATALEQELGIRPGNARDGFLTWPSGPD